LHLVLILAIPMVGFSNGCAELALRKPPPLVPSCLIATWLAIGPPGIDCVAPSTVVTIRWPDRFCTTPEAPSTIAASAAIGSSTRVTVRVRSTQKLPIVFDRERTSPRTSATATAMPAAADTKFCTASPAICVRWLMVDSPAYDCQFVLVTKLTAVFHAVAAPTALWSSGFSGRRPCSRCSP
jgi:hypothetical protein